jgi:hypothetical protein
MRSSISSNTIPDQDLILIPDVIRIFEGRISYQGALKLIWSKELPALKLQGKWVLSRRVVEAYKAKKFGLNRLGNFG